MPGLMFNGIDLKATYNFVVSSVSGRDAAPIEEKTIELPYVDGAIVIDKKVKPRNLTITGWVYDTSSQAGALQKKNDVINLFMQSKGYPMELKFPDSGRSIYVTVSGTPFSVENTAGAIFNAFGYNIKVEFIAYDPYFYGDEEDWVITNIDKIPAYADEPLEASNHNLTTHDRSLKLQPYTIVDFLGNYGLEGYGVYPNPNSYGLHDDGKNIFTVRSDDLPFSDVDYSFAVEEGTQNIVTGYTGTGYRGIDNSVEKPAGYENSNQNVYKYDNLTESTYVKAFGVDIPNPTTVAGGESISISGWIKYVKGSLNYPKLLISVSGTGIFLSDLTEVEKDGNWHYFKRTWTNDTGTAYDFKKAWADITSDTVVEAEAYAFQIQVEKKPFATSFVDGTRAYGIIQLPSSLVNPSGTVFTTWFKINAINTAYPRIFDQSGSWSVYTQSDKKLRFKSYSTSVGHEITTLSENVWYFMVLIMNGTTHTIYLYDEIGNLTKKTIIDTSIPSSSNPLLLGAYENPGSELNGLFSNLYIGAYDSTVWTDTFVQELYNQQVLAKALKLVENSPTPPSALKNKYSISKMGELLVQDKNLWNVWFNKSNFDKKIVTAGWNWGDA
jgi:hypothetical protein